MLGVEGMEIQTNRWWSLERHRLIVLLVILLAVSPMFLALIGELHAAEGAVTVTQNDSDSDRVVDTADVDDDNDGIPDILEIAPDGRDLDSDNDGIPNRLDLDSDNDGILDWHESGAPQQLDLSSLRPLGGRLAGPVGENGMINEFESPLDTGKIAYRLANTDGDELPDYIDLDSDNDGLPDLVETGVAAALDSNHDARIDAPPGSVGSDGIADVLQSTNDQACCDITGDGVDDIIPQNTDGTDLPDFQDLDSDNDGNYDIVEAGGRDQDGDGRIDNFVDDGSSADGLDDALIRVPLTPTDLNGNGVLDHLDPFVVGNSGTESGSYTEVPEPSGDPDDTVADTPETSGDPADTVVDTPAASGDPADMPEATGESADTAADAPTSVMNDSASGSIRTGLSGSGCSIQSTSIDALLILCVIASISLLGWRYTMRRTRR